MLLTARRSRSVSLGDVEKRIALDHRLSAFSLGSIASKQWSGKKKPCRERKFEEPVLGKKVRVSKPEAICP